MYSHSMEQWTLDMHFYITDLGSEQKCHKKQTKRMFLLQREAPAGINTGRLCYDDNNVLLGTGLPYKVLHTFSCPSSSRERDPLKTRGHSL